MPKRETFIRSFTMRVTDIIKQHHTSFSFEFFPPKTDKGWEKLFTTIRNLLPLKPGYVSVTYGAGGSTRDRTHEVIRRIKEETDLTVVAHLTCVGSTKDDIAAILDTYAEIGVHNILALRGDLPEGQDEFTGDFTYARELVAFIKECHPDFCVGVAAFPEGHPKTPNRLLEMDYLKEKVDAGADYMVTQLFFDNRDYYDFRARCRMMGINIPIIAGIMPVSGKKTLQRMAELSPGTRFPAPLLRMVNRAETDEYVAKSGIHWATHQINDLIDNDVPGVHLYTLNNSRATLEICDQLGLRDFDL